MAPHPACHDRQKGVVLVIGLVFLLIMTIIGVSAIRSTTLDEKIAGNARDRSLAFQAAEAALRDAERDIWNSRPSHARHIHGLTHFTTDCGDSTAADTDDGLCYNGPGGYPNPVWSIEDMAQPPSVPYGRFTGESAIPDVAAQPRYLIEGFKQTLPGNLGGSFYYRITVRAQGARPETVVMLQTFFKP